MGVTSLQPTQRGGPHATCGHSDSHARVHRDAHTCAHGDAKTYAYGHAHIHTHANPHSDANP